jgi:hypothetical protein
MYLCTYITAHFWPLHEWLGVRVPTYIVAVKVLAAKDAGSKKNGTLIR